MHARNNIAAFPAADVGCSGPTRFDEEGGAQVSRRGGSSRYLHRESILGCRANSARLSV